MHTVGHISILKQTNGILNCKLDTNKDFTSNIIFWLRLEKANFPVHLLPKPVPLNTVVGHTKPNGYFADLITENIPVVVPYGDLQSMMHLAFCKNPDTIGQLINQSVCLIIKKQFLFSGQHWYICSNMSTDGLFI